MKNSCVRSCVSSEPNNRAVPGSSPARLTIVLPVAVFC
jgi:hypothetical protein